MTEEIMALCQAMGAGGDREELLLPLVRAAEERFAARLRAGVSPADCGSAFPLAVAMAAVDGLEQAAGGAGIASFTAGEVSIRMGRGRKGESLSAQAERLLAPWLAETGFAFQGVKG